MSTGRTLRPKNGPDAKRCAGPVPFCAASTQGCAWSAASRPRPLWAALRALRRVALTRCWRWPRSPAASRSPLRHQARAASCSATCCSATRRCTATTPVTRLVLTRPAGGYTARTGLSACNSLVRASRCSAAALRQHPAPLRRPARCAPGHAQRRQRRAAPHVPVMPTAAPAPAPRPAQLPARVGLGRSERRAPPRQARRARAPPRARRPAPRCLPGAQLRRRRSRARALARARTTPACSGSGAARRARSPAAGWRTRWGSESERRRALRRQARVAAGPHAHRGRAARAGRRARGRRGGRGRGRARAPPGPPRARGPGLRRRPGRAREDGRAAARAAARPAAAARRGPQRHDARGAAGGRGARGRARAGALSKHPRVRNACEPAPPALSVRRAALPPWPCRAQGRSAGACAAARGGAELEARAAGSCAPPPRRPARGLRTSRRAGPPAGRAACLPRLPARRWARGRAARRRRSRRAGLPLAGVGRTSACLARSCYGERALPASAGGRLAA